MRNGSYETSNVDQVVRKLPGARELLREHRIDTSSSLRLRDDLRSYFRSRNEDSIDCH